MSLNWVERNTSISVPFTPLPLETILHAQEERVTIKLLPQGQPNAETIILKGHLYLTTQRVVVLADAALKQKTDLYDSFSLLFKDITSHKLDMPWFGSNKFLIQFRISNPDGGLNYLYPWLLTIEFVYGGAIRFTEKFTDIITRFNNDQIDELPRYSE